MADFKKNIVLLSDPRIRAVAVHDSEEPFIDLTDANRLLLVDQSRAQIGNQTPYFACVRRTVALLLAQAQKNLPLGLRLLVKEGFRPVSLQREYYDRYLKKLAASHPEWTQSQLSDAAAAYVAPPEMAPHSTGAAVDLTLIDHHGREIEMGSVFNADPQLADFATYTDAPSISPEAQRHRALLRECMEKAGFVNYPTEWWHWSFGDRYWAYAKNENRAIYGGVEAPTFEIE